MARIGTMETADPLAGLVPKGLRRLEDPQRDLPRVAKDAKLMREIEAAVREAPTPHELHQDDARRMAFLQPQSVHDIEFVLMQRKPGGYRSPSLSRRILSLLSAENHKAWFQQVWTGVTGASTRDHPAPYSLELAERLIRMFSFVGDTVLDPFLGTGTTSVAAARWGGAAWGWRSTRSTSPWQSAASVQSPPTSSERRNWRYIP